MLKSSQFEPGVLSLFRLFTVIQWLLLGLGLLSAFRKPDGIPDYFTIFFWLQTTFLLLYLNWNWLAQKLGESYLALALIIASLGPVLWQELTVGLRLAHGLDGEMAQVDPGRLYVWLLLPLVLISVQYGWREMLAFLLGTALLELGLALLLRALGGPVLNATLTNAGVRILLFGIAGFLIVRLTRAQRQYRAELIQKNQQLTRYAATLEQLAISRERNRMARELHDTLSHTLSAVNVQLKALEVLLETNPEAARQTLRQTQELTRTGLYEARRALHDLRARPVEELGLVLALQRLAQQAAERAGLQLQLNLPPQAGFIAPEIEQTVYRIAEEALNNVIRHANASVLEVFLSLNTKGLRLSIADNGQGFDATQPTPPNHFGLVGMRERASLIGGKLEVFSAPGQGTRLEFWIEHL